MTERNLPAPPVTPESAPFFAAAAAGKFLIGRCTQCGRAHWYPRALCPFCFGATEWQEASGRGAIYSFSVMRRVTPPYAIAYVTLDEGPTMMTNLVDCDFDGLRIGGRVQLVFKPSEGGPPVPCFRPE
ncbi:MAG: OB-fold domain-containing protein [Rhodospirillales bacterium]|nr:OB-fold domain-containing protein [Rhodospirillales bacterium]